MALDSVLHQPAVGHRYQLSPSDRAAILAGSDSAEVIREVERQRQDFIQKHGSDLPDFFTQKNE